MLATVDVDRNEPRAGSETIAANADEAWRFGFGLAQPADADLWAGRLGASWYLDWGVAERSAKRVPIHWQMVHVTEQGVRPAIADIVDIARRFPGQVWIIGNEPDVIWQDNIPPELYAQRYHELYTAIQEVDRSAQLVAGSIAQVTPLRLAYLDRVLEAYSSQYGQAMPVDIWSIHTYVLREERESRGIEIPPGFDEAHGRLYEVSDHGRLDLLEQQLRDFRMWMAEHGYRAQPLVVTEFGILMPESYGFSEQDVADYMRAAFDLFLSLRDDNTGLMADGGRLVQQWAWFSLQSNEYPAGDLVDLATKQFTLSGISYSTYLDGLGSDEPEVIR